ncbi:MAG: hypothetical protein FWD57_10130 [Polyangiaceae bacterium]|nr:hypothetical protein [Polyangiaceae bacterium]
MLPRQTQKASYPVPDVKLFYAFAHLCSAAIAKDPRRQPTENRREGWGCRDEAYSSIGDQQHVFGKADASVEINNEINNRCTHGAGNESIQKTYVQQ